ncbi:AAA family ATPase [Aeromonas sp. sif2433]|uniref:AAA family ATPase n=1 Tax=Aeromonas sp. sif2433 TaxID=2854794 RepID=UPI001C473A31|nr:AAA family ATPase [Aeromonas sp. sif2433]MBV7413230.1 AAA family ATPase [Aeromonas sp. sif2433]
MKNSTLQFEQVKFEGLKNINVLVGRNGAGKSRLLRNIDQYCQNNNKYFVRYISPERAGVFKRDGNIMTNMESYPNWLADVRRKNQADNFKAASANLLREVETAYLRRMQDDPEIRLDPTRNFRTERLDSINKLLANLTVCQEGSNFVFRNNEGELVQPDEISSGESESIALAVEIMYFFDNIRADTLNILLLDEPDVHLHPDLQARLASFLIKIVDSVDKAVKDNIIVILATHSTPFICALSQSINCVIGTKNFNINNVSFVEVSDQLKKIAPFFGHPLSLSLSQDVMLILEGEDDERVWQQASRTSQGRIKLFPVIASSVDQQTQLENFTAELIESLYDNPKAYSLRDGDGVQHPLDPIRSVVRFRLQCYAIENLLVTEQALHKLGTNWEGFQEKAKEWLDKNEQHKDYKNINDLIISPDRLRNIKIKDIRQLICAISGSTKPWEVIVGQALGALDPLNLPQGEHDLPMYIGLDTTSILLTA